MWVTNLGSVARTSAGWEVIPVAPDLVAKASRRTDMSANISDFFCSSSRATSLSCRRIPLASDSQQLAS